jgi:SAM-dependent methyltransferase
VKTGRGDYVLGTDADELERLRRQHEVWRPLVEDLWSRAGLAAGQTILDLGCGPGFATLDLARIVGPSGRVIAVDRSEAYLEALAARVTRERLDAVTVLARDLDHPADWAIPPLDAIWSRWSLSFLRRPREALSHVTAALAPGGVLIAQEYLAYAQWQLVPRLPEFDRFVALVMDAWRGAGGEPDLAAPMIGWLPDLGLDIVTIRNVSEVAAPSEPFWAWPAAFVETGLRRLTGLGAMSETEAASTWQAFRERELDGRTRMVTPAVVQCIARKR